MKQLPVAVSLLIFLAPFERPCLGQQAGPEARPKAPEAVEVSQQEVESHRIGPRPILRATLVGFAEILTMSGIHVQVTVGPDGAVTGAAADVGVPGLPGVPPGLLSQAEAAIRNLRYRPFERNGRVVPAKFEEDLSVLPPELQPLQHIPFPVVQDWKSVRMTLERTGCFGSCPAYKVEVHGDGTVLYEGRDFVAIKGQHRGSVPPETVHELVNKFRQADYYSLSDGYVWSATDLPTFRTSIEIDGKSKKVTDYAGEHVGMPLAVRELERAIDELTGTERWTKGNANTVDILKREKWNFRSAEAADTLARVAEYGSADAVLNLIAVGVPVIGHLMPLPQVVWRGDIVILGALLDAGAGGPNGKDLGEALATALRSGKIESARLLLDHGASPDWRDKGGGTILMAAATSGVPAVVEEILERRPGPGVDARLQRPNGADGSGTVALRGRGATDRWGQGCRPASSGWR
ncbi:MAG TPA: DUF6438 domain-containing protein [Terriglobia bacterium]|nr:DUF6438 domain-containing protein [Terriglobia bacterium]